MNFWDLEGTHRERTRVIEPGGQALSGAALLDRVHDAALALDAIGQRTFGFLLCSQSVEALSLYLACLRQHHVPLLLDADMPEASLQALCELKEEQLRSMGFGYRQVAAERHMHPKPFKI